MRLVEEIFMGEKIRSKKLDVARGGEDIEHPPPLEDEKTRKDKD